ncbi:MAG: cobalamin-dependent protein [bacterium]|nr:cobalamin-dependent protein [bacterium]
MAVKKVQLICATANVGRGANDGVYYPAGLLTIANALQSEDVEAVVDDQHHSEIVIRNDADIVGIQTSSTLCHKNALEIAQAAKNAGKLVVLGGPHATALPGQILRNRPEIDFVIRGKGEQPLVELVHALEGKGSLGSVPSLSWRKKEQVVHNPGDSKVWRYDKYVPLPLETLSCGVGRYWEAYHKVINPQTDYSFLIFTHFVCGFRERRVGRIEPGNPFPVRSELTGEPKFCSFCALQDVAGPRLSKDILAELRAYLDTWNIPKGSRVALKCYGDNIGPQGKLVADLVRKIGGCAWWNDYHFSWTFYCQSSYLSKKLAEDLARIGTDCLFIGFDSINDEVQRLNALGTSRLTHNKAVELCKRHGIRIQAASVLGLIGENPDSLEENYQYYRGLLEEGVLERINSAILFIIPGTAAYEMLVGREVWIGNLDLLPTDKIREAWIKHFCPHVNLELLREYAEKIDDLSPGPHASMGYESSRFKSRKTF